MGLSLAEEVALLPEDVRDAILSEHPDDELAHDWSFWGRPEQQEPDGDWDFWLVNAGRGFGKTITGAEWIIKLAKEHETWRMALIGPTAADVRDVMIEGESGILARSAPYFMPAYQPSKRRLVWPNGAQAFCYSAEEPQRLRGPQHHAAWADELAAWKYQETWDQMLFGLRLGLHPRALATTTPRPIPRIRELLKDPACHVTRGSTFDNAQNLAGTFLDNLMKKYEGTRLGRQELEAEILDDTPGALWTLSQIDSLRVQKKQVPDLVKICVAIDPSATAKPESDEAGIIMAGVGTDGHAYVLDDKSGILMPNQWASRAVNLYHEHDADMVVGEVNNGGDMVETIIRNIDRQIPYEGVRASRGKATRAQPVAALYEQGRVHHVGALPTLEDQQVTWVPGDDSPDRMDALVWAITWLMLGEDNEPSFRSL